MQFVSLVLLETLQVSFLPHPEVVAIQFHLSLSASLILSVANFQSRQAVALFSTQLCHLSYNFHFFFVLFLLDAFHISQLPVLPLSFVGGNSIACSSMAF